MIKRILIILSLLGLSVYLVMAMTLFNPAPSEEICTGVDFCVKDSTRSTFINRKSIEGILKGHDLLPVGEILSHIDLTRIEETLEEHPYIEQAQCYKTRGGKIRITIEQQLPLMRIINTKGESYYLDGQGEVMPNAGLPANVVVATGHITTDYAQTHLLDLAKLLQRDAFWGNQIQQIHVLQNGDIEFAPRVGKHIVKLGQPDEIRQKLGRLRRFYSTLGEIGWNKYARINVEFDNQIICTKK